MTVKETAYQPVNGDENVPIILIDNNMIQHFLSKDVGSKLETILKEVADMGATLAISQVVVYEALKAIIFNPKKADAVIEFLDKYLVRYPISEDVLVQAARVHEMYGNDKNTKGHIPSISTEDIIIATTAMMLGAYVITCDPNDFPMPFFRETNREIVHYQTKNRRKHIVIYLLEPDQNAITVALEQLSPPPTTKSP